MSAKKSEKRLGIDPLGMLMGIDTDKEAADDNQGNVDKPDNPVNQDKQATLDNSVNHGNMDMHGKPLNPGKPVNSVKPDKHVLPDNPVGTEFSVNQVLSVKPVNPPLREEEPVLSTRKGVTPGYERHTYVVRQDLADLVEAKAWWDRKDIKQVMEDALVQYFADLSVRPIPDSARKQRVPRPRNSK